MTWREACFRMVDICTLEYNRLKWLEEAIKAGEEERAARKKLREKRHKEGTCQERMP